MSGSTLTGQDARQSSLSTTTVRTTVRTKSRLGALSTHWLYFPLFVFAVHFIIVQLAATLAFKYGRATWAYDIKHARNGFVLTFHGAWTGIIVPMSRWDGLWYIYYVGKANPTIQTDQLQRFGGTQDTLWPLLPWVIQYGARFTGLAPAVVGFLFVNLCFAVALIALYRLISIEFTPRIARRSLWCLVLLPTSFYFHAIYTEAPFLCFATLAFLAARNNHWFAAAFACLLAATLRSHGLILILPLLAIYRDQVKQGRERWSPKIVVLLLPLAGFWFYGRQWNAAGYNWSAIARIQRKRFEIGTPPWKGIGCAFRDCSYERVISDKPFPQLVPGPDWSWAMQLLNHPSWRLITNLEWRREVSQSGDIDLLFFVGCLLLMAVGLWRLPGWMKVYTLSMLTLVLIRLPFLHPLDGMARFALLLFPLAIVLALLLEDRLTQIIAGSVSLVALVLLTIQFANWYWVT
jgi:hypothetical protein